jgi:hypothetical protein
MDKKEIKNILCNSAQLIAGWRDTTPTAEWSKFDQECYDGIIKILKSLEPTSRSVVMKNYWIKRKQVEKDAMELPVNESGLHVEAVEKTIAALEAAELATTSNMPKVPCPAWSESPMVRCRLGFPGVCGHRCTLTVTAPVDYQSASANIAMAAQMDAWVDAVKRDNFYNAELIAFFEECAQRLRQ